MHMNGYHLPCMLPACMGRTMREQPLRQGARRRRRGGGGSGGGCALTAPPAAASSAAALAAAGVLPLSACHAPRCPDKHICAHHAAATWAGARCARSLHPQHCSLPMAVAWRRLRPALLKCTRARRHTPPRLPAAGCGSVMPLVRGVLAWGLGVLGLAWGSTAGPWGSKTGRASVDSPCCGLCCGPSNGHWASLVGCDPHWGGGHTIARWLHPPEHAQHCLQARPRGWSSGAA